MRALEFRISRISAVVGAIVLGLAGAVGCSGSPAAAVRPAPHTAAAGLGETSCSATPLVIDLASNERVAVEAALASGRSLLARHRCENGSAKLDLLTECKLFERYSYGALTRREEIVRMNDADAVRARLPLTGAGLAANLSGELSRGRALDLALVSIGRYVSQKSATYSDDVPSECEKATHAIASVTTGAFAMTVGTRGEARAIAEVFSAGVSGESRSDLSRVTRDGDLGACRAAEGAGNAPRECRAPLRIELRAIDPRTRARARCEDERSVSDCGDWLRRSLSNDDKPGARAAGELLLGRCRQREREACSLAREYAIKARNTSFDLKEIERLACESGDACISHGQNLMVAGKIEDGYTVLSSACFHHDELAACWVLAKFIEEDNVGPAPGAARDKLIANLYARGCATSSSACERYGELYKRGLRAEGEFRGMKAIIGSCADEKFGCSLAAAAYALGIGVPRDAVKARKAWALHCEKSKDTYIANQMTCEMPKAYLP